VSLPYIYLTKSSGSIPDNQTWEDKVEFDADYVVEKIFVMRKDGGSFTRSTITIWLENKPITKDVVPCALFPPSEFDSPTLNLEVKTNQVLKWDLKNEEGTALEFFLVLKLRPKK